MVNIDEDVGVANLNISSKPKRRRSSALKPQSSTVSLIKQKKRKNSTPILKFEKSSIKKKFTVLRDLSLFALNASDECPDNIKLTSRNSIEKVITILVPNLPIKFFNINSNLPSILPIENNIPKELGFLKEQFDEIIVTTAPGNKHSIYPTMNAFVQRPLNKKEKKILTDKLKNEKMSIPKLKMSLSQLNENKYPIHPETEGLTPELIEPLKNDWVDTKNFEHDGSHTFAVDCEMCETATGKVLTRFSMVDFNGNVIIDEFVKPLEEITNYLTPFSGITKELLENVETSLKDIQVKFLSIVSSTDYLIGHSLENDLNVMKIRHPNIIDTSIIFEHPRGPPFKSSLKYITSKYLEKTIQEGSHDSIIDSTSCLDLVKLKLIEGGLLGKVISNSSINEDIKRINKSTRIIDYGKVQPNQDIYVQCCNDELIYESIIDSIDNSELIVANFKNFEDETLTENQTIELFKDLNHKLKKIYEKLPNNSILIISSGNGNLSEFNKLKQRKDLFGKEYSENLNSNSSEVKSSWTLDNEAELTKSLELARIGVSFVKIKNTNEKNEIAIE